MKNPLGISSVPETRLFFRVLDLFLSPIMFVLGGFRLPIQESHPWHMTKTDGKNINKTNSVTVDKQDPSARFLHGSPFGLYHMPIFGGLSRYVVIGVENFDGHWHVGWKDDICQISSLKIFDNRLKLLYGRKIYDVFAFNDKGDFLSVKIVGEGKIGDRKYEGVRLF